MQDATHPGEEKQWFGHPRGLSTLFNTELWERFSYYGMRALLTLYMVRELGFDEAEKAYPIYGAYGALVYAFPVLGGWIANKWIGYSRAIVLGGALMAMGHFVLAIPSEPAFFAALALLCVGNGFFKPNLASTVGRLYEPGDARRDRGFTIYYMSVNVGALLAPMVVGELGQKVDWHFGFTLAGFGMCVGLVWYVRGKRHIGERGEPDNPELMKAPVFAGLNRLHLVVIGSFLMVPLTTLVFYYSNLGAIIIQAVSVIVLVALIWMALTESRVQRMRMFALLILMFFHMLFWSGFEQAGSSFNVMTDQHVDKNLFGWTPGAAFFQAVNPMFIILLAPLFTLLWKVLEGTGKNPSISLKFGLALIQLGLGFWALTLGIAQADAAGLMPVFFLFFCYFLHTTGELCLAPVGLSAVTKLAPPRWVGFCMGAWFLTIANAHIVAAGIAALTGGSSTAVAGEAKLVGATNVEVVATEAVSGRASDSTIVLDGGAMSLQGLVGNLQGNLPLTDFSLSVEGETLSGEAAVRRCAVEFTGSDLPVKARFELDGRTIETDAVLASYTLRWSEQQVDGSLRFLGEAAAFESGTPPPSVELGEIRVTLPDGIDRSDGDVSVVALTVSSFPPELEGDLSTALPGTVAIEQYGNVFYQVFLFMVASGVVLILLTPFIKRLIPDTK